MEPFSLSQVCVFFLCLVFFGYSGFLPQPRNRHVKLIGGFKLFVEASVNVHDCLTRLSLCGPVMDARQQLGQAPVRLNRMRRVWKIHGWNK